MNKAVYAVSFVVAKILALFVPHAKDFGEFGKYRDKDHL